MAPELRSGRNKANEASDLYSAGLVLYVALTGQEPFDLHATNLHERALREVPPPLREILARVGTYQPEERYGSAGEMLQALGAARARLEDPVPDVEAPARPPLPLIPPGLFEAATDPTASAPAGHRETMVPDGPTPPGEEVAPPAPPRPAEDSVATLTLPPPLGARRMPRVGLALGLGAVGVSLLVLFGFWRDGPTPEEATDHEVALTEPAITEAPTPAMTDPVRAEEHDPSPSPTAATRRQAPPVAALPARPAPAEPPPAEPAVAPTAPPAAEPPPTWPIRVLADPIEGFARVGGRVVPVTETVTLPQGVQSFEFTGSGWTARCQVDIQASVRRVKFTKGKEGCSLLP